MWAVERKVLFFLVLVLAFFSRSVGADDCKVTVLIERHGQKTGRFDGFERDLNSLGRYAARKDKPIILLHGIRNTNEWRFRQEILEIAKTKTNMRMKAYMSQHDIESVRKNQRGQLDIEVGRRLQTNDALESMKVFHQIQNVYYCFCGPTEFFMPIMNTFEENGISTENMHSQSFNS